MPLSPGSRLGHYEIVAAIGAGGMGEVYRAHDARLRRDVAIKVLPQAFAADEERLRRFEQEALATAALNHPNILVVYDVGKDDGTAYVALELLEGQTVRDLLTEQAVPLRKVIDLAGQTAAGLAAAHDKGIVHRDLKPENLFVTTDGRLKILDFGLAKQVTPEGVASNVTRTVLAGTEPGMVLGTMGYMAPEQVRGGTIDHRADIFSFGAILYELLSGQRAFTGATPADTMTAILKESPADLATTRTTVPPSLARVVDRCLEKHPSARFQSASDLAFALQTLGTSTGSGSTIAPAIVAPRPGLGMWIAGAAVVALAVLAFAAWRGFGVAPDPVAPMAMLEVAAPEGHEFGAQVALSPDGRYLAFIARRTANEGDRQLWLRDLSTGTQHPMPGSDGAGAPFWAPDGSTIGFFSQGRLRGIDRVSEKVRVICDAPGGRAGGSWNQAGVIVFATESGVPLQRVNADGLTPPAAIGTLRGFRPFFLPDGRHFVFHNSRVAGTIGINVADLESGEAVLVRPTGREAKFADGQLVFVEDDHIVAAPFDPVRRELTGEPTLLAAFISHNGETNANFSVASGHLLAFRDLPVRTRQLVWRGRDGRRLGIVEGDGQWRNPELSPDDSRIAVERDEQKGTGLDIWVLDVIGGGGRAVAAQRDGERAPFWSVDGSRILYLPSLMAEELMSVLPGGGPETPLAGSAGTKGFTHGISPDGKLLIGFRINAAGNRDILVTPVGSPDKVFRFAESAFNETQPSLSPDGVWMAYVSDELGLGNTTDVFLQAFPGGGQKIHVTAGTTGGVQPRWGHDGRQLYYIGRDRRLMSVTVERAGNTLRVGTPQPLFEVNAVPENGLGTRAIYDVTRDGQRFIVAEDREERPEGSVPITVLVDWKSRVAAGVK